MKDYFMTKNSFAAEGTFKLCKIYLEKAKFDHFSILTHKAFIVNHGSKH